jgi:hypothetical protein
MPMNRRRNGCRRCPRRSCRRRRPPALTADRRPFPAPATEADVAPRALAAERRRGREADPCAIRFGPGHLDRGGKDCRRRRARHRRDSLPRTRECAGTRSSGNGDPRFLRQKPPTQWERQTGAPRAGTMRHPESRRGEASTLSRWTDPACRNGTERASRGRPRDAVDAVRPCWRHGTGRPLCGSCPGGRGRRSWQHAMAIGVADAGDDVQRETL